MLACLINGQGRAEVTEVPVPGLQAGEVLIKLATAGICGTDIEKVHGAYGLGGILGHEVSGTIVSVGDEVTDLRKSDRVIAHHHVPCYNCEYCRYGDRTMCDLFKRTNFDPCGLAEYFRVPEAKIIGVDILPHRLEMAQKLGADESIDPSSKDVPEQVTKSTRVGVDLAIVSTGNQKAIQPALASV